ncbi:MAG: glycoside hydrolase family 2 protein, partial [Bacteroidales bacterium]
GTADNAHHPWRFNVDSLLVAGENTLRIDFPAMQQQLDSLETLAPPFPNGPRAHLRKPAYQFGWDWAPKLLTTGLSGAVELLHVPVAKVLQAGVVTDSVGGDKAYMALHVQVLSTKAHKMSVALQVDGKGTIKRDLAVTDEMQHAVVRFTIHDPELWWPHDQGAPVLYPFQVALSTTQGRAVDKYAAHFGIRTTQLLQQADSVGQSFVVAVNGRKVFMKGANIIPADLFEARINDSTYQKLVADMAAANMNMVRVWGGGRYLPTAFYHACDSLGVAVWQDFMFANNLFPADSGFCAGVKREVDYQVSRLKKHPSVLVWCGNNEVDEAWHNWGWERQYSDSLRPIMRSNYLRLFHDSLPRWLHNQLSEAPYVPSSPTFGRGDKRSRTHGDNHYWGVWHDGEPFEMFFKRQGRFASEYGFQAYPPREVVLQMRDAGNPESGLAHHQKHHRGEELIRMYMERDFHIPQADTTYWYVSQLLQARGMYLAAIAHRMAKPVCMGSLYWQLNDCWPAVSWSSVAWGGKWKALHHEMARAFAPTTAAAVGYGDSLQVWLLNDSPQKQQATIGWYVYDVFGNRLLQDSLQLTTTAHPQLVTTLQAPEKFWHQQHVRELVVTPWIRINGKRTEGKTEGFVVPDKIRWQDPQIEVTTRQIPKGCEVTLLAKVPVYGAALHANVPGEFRDNYFTLQPGVKKRVFFTEGSVLTRENIFIMYYLTPTKGS